MSLIRPPGRVIRYSSVTKAIRSGTCSTAWFETTVSNSLSGNGYGIVPRSWITSAAVFGLLSSPIAPGVLFTPQPTSKIFIDEIVQQAHEHEAGVDAKAPLLLKEGWQPLRLTGWLIS